MANIRKGRAAWVFEDNFDVDLIVGINNISHTDMDRLLKDTMQAYDKDFKNSVRKGDFLVGGSNFGFGHAHPQPMMVMREIGIKTVIAESYAFNFFRSELASGMALITCSHISKTVSRWDELEVDLEKGTLRNLTKGEELSLEPLPPVVLDIIDAGGIVPYLKRRGPEIANQR